MHGQAAAPLLPVLHCRDGGVSAFGLHQHLPRGGVSGGRLAATAEIAPVVEEMMKLLPLVFYLLVFEPESERIKPAAITVA